MKTLRFITPLFLLATLLFSCTTEEYYTTDGSYQETWYSKDVTIQGNQWELIGEVDEINSYYEYVFYDKDLDTATFKEGEMTPYYDGVFNVYLYDSFNTDKEVQMPLPYTLFGFDPDAAVNKKYYSIQYSYDFKDDGTIAFKAHVSDYYTSTSRPGTMVFRVAAVW